MHFTEHPSDVRKEETATGIKWIGVRLGIFMMHPMHPAPTINIVLSKLINRLSLQDVNISRIRFIFKKEGKPAVPSFVQLPPTIGKEVWPCRICGPTSGELRPWSRNRKSPSRKQLYRLKDKKLVFFFYWNMLGLQMKLTPNESRPFGDPRYSQVKSVETCYVT